MFGYEHTNIASHAIRSANILLLKFLIAIFFLHFASPLSVFSNDSVGGQTVQSSDVRNAVKRATKLVRNGSLLEAEVMLRSTIETNPDSVQAKIELGHVLNKQRKLREAYDLVFPVAKADNRNSRALAVLGMTMLSAGRFSDAHDLFYSAIVLNKREHLAWAGMGTLDFYENRLLDSYENLNEAAFHGPDEPDYLFALGQISARIEKFKEAATAYRRFLDVSPRSDVDRRERIRGLISFLNVLGNASALYVPAGRDSTIVDVELVGNRPIIHLRINGKPDLLRFVLDTGSGITVLSESTAKRMGVRSVARGGQARGVGGDGKFDIVYGLLKDVSIGDVRVRTVPVYIRKFNAEGQSAIDGYIGLAMISKFLTTIDYGELKFILKKKDDAIASSFDDATIALPLRLTTSGFLSGEVEIEGVSGPLNFIVDTGASVSVISNQVASDEAVRQKIRQERLRVIGAAGVTENVPFFDLPRVSFGKHTRSDISAIALDLDVINEAAGFEQSGILGGNFLRNYRLTFDFKNSKVLFSPLTAEHD